MSHETCDIFFSGLLVKEAYGCFQKYGKTPKSSILIGFSIINHPFRGTPIFGNTLVKEAYPSDRCRFKQRKRTQEPIMAWMHPDFSFQGEGGKMPLLNEAMKLHHLSAHSCRFYNFSTSPSCSVYQTYSKLFDILCQFYLGDLKEKDISHIYIYI